MKRAAGIITALVTIIVLVHPISRAARHSAAENGADGEAYTYRDIAGVTEQEKLEIEALIEKHGGFSYGHLLEAEAYMLPDGTVAGFTIELCKLLSDLFGAEFTPKHYGQWQEMHDALQTGEIDFSGGFAPTRQRLENYYMTMPIAGRTLNLYVRKDGSISSEQQLNGKKIGVLYGSYLIDSVLEYYPGYSFVPIDISSYAEGVKLLEDGEIDAIIATSASSAVLSDYDTIEAKEFFKLAYYPVSIATADPALAPIITVIDKYMSAGGFEQIFELYEQWELEYKRENLFASLTEPELEFLDKMVKGGFKVDIGYQHDAYPASFYNETEKEYQGVSIDVLREITKLTGLEFEPLTTTHTTTLAEILEKLKTGDISMMTQLIRTESRENDYIWSEVVYLTTNYALLSKQDYPVTEMYQVPWERVGTVYKSAHEVMFETWFPNHRSQIIYNTTNEAFDALERGEIDLLMLSENMLLQQTNLRQKTGFKVNIKFDVQLDSLFGFSKDEAVLRSIVDKAMAYINIDRFADEWNNKVFDYESEIARVRSVYLLWLAAMMMIALVALLVLLIKNNRLGNSLMSQTTMLTAIYKSIPDTVFSKNIRGYYTSCNTSFEKQAGLSESEIIGKTYSEVFGKRVLDTANRYSEIDRQIIHEGITCKVEEEVIFPDGSRKLLETLKAPLVQNDTVIGIIGMGRDVTERKEIQSRLDSIINTAQIAFIMAVDGIIYEANRYCTEHVGMKHGDDIRQYYAAEGQRDEVMALTERYGTVSNLIIPIKTASGEVHRFLASVTLTEYEQKKAHIVWAIDVEENEKISDLLREIQLSFQAVLDSLPVPVRIVDLETREIVYVNGSLLELLKYDATEELCGRKITEIVPEVLSDGSLSSESELLLITETSRPVTVDMEYLTKTGEVIEAVVASRVIDYKGRRTSIGIIKDLTQEKRMAQVLRDSAEREKEANQAKSLFLANMSHEIRTPMNGIIGMTDLLLNERLSERQKQYTKDIKTSAESLLGIINDILDLSKIAEGKLQITPVDVDLSVMVRNTVSMMRFSAQSKGLEFIDDIQIGIREYVRADDVRLNQVIVNLLSNAVKFTKSGSVTLTVKIEDGNILFAVKDTGIGIREEERELIFAAFEQADRRKNRAIKGTGLGLSITKNLVELMGGRIWVESEYGAGSTFYVTVPYVQGNESAVEVSDAAFEYVFAPTAQILLVDDIQTNLTVGSGLLRLCGITADVALSGYEAIERVKERDYDIVFMDHMMPDMDGVETTQIIRSLGGKYSKIPIIALTANAVGEARAYLLSAGLDDYLSKPVDKSELMAILRKWMPPEKIKSAQERAEISADEGYSQALLRASAVEGLDIDLALSRIGGLSDVLERSIKQTAFSIDEKLKIMDDSLAKGDLARFALDAHGLKGAFANIGAMKYSELAAALEIGAKADNMPLCLDKFTIFVSVLRDFAAQLKKCFNSDDGAKKLPGSKEILSAQITEAIVCLESFEAEDARVCLNKLTEYTFGEETDELLDSAIAAVSRFSYSEAIALLKELTFS